MGSLYFDKTISGKKYTGGAYWYKPGENGLFQGVSIVSGSYTEGRSVELTGYYTTTARGAKMLQTTTAERYIDLTDGDWQAAGAVVYSQQDAQSLVDKMIENNKKICMCNLFCARFSYRLSQQEKELLYELQMRLQQRNQRLSQDGLCTGMTTSRPAGYAELEKYMQNFMNTGGVGLVISTSTIIVSAVVIASLSTAAYFAYKYLYEQSEQDVRYSKELTKVLQSKLTEQEYQQLLDETKGLVTKAKIKQMVAGTSGILKWSLIATGIYMLYTQLTKKGSKHATRKN